VHPGVLACVEPVYQPQIELRSGRVVGLEALARFREPCGRLLGAAAVLQYAQDPPARRALGRHMLRRSTREIASLGVASGLALAVNVEADHLSDPALVPDVIEALGHSGLAPDRLELELTETEPLAYGGALEINRAALEGLGVRLAIDDYGTGYADAPYLRRLAPHTVKLAAHWIAERTPETRDALGHLVSILRDAGVGIVAEGVEHRWQDALVSAHAPIGRAQGYLYSRPLTLEALRSSLSLEHRIPRAAALVRHRRRPPTPESIP